MDIAITGATGAVGSALVVHLLKGTALVAGDRLILCGHHTAATERHLLPEQADLLDAFEDERIAVEVVDDYEDIWADIVVVAPGATICAEHPTRRDLAAANRSIFAALAERCARRLPEALFVVVSNPVELAVDIFARAVERHRVVGMGAQQDSLRFARSVAEALGINRGDVRATVMGEHGPAMVPIWSSVKLLRPTQATVARLGDLRDRCSVASLPARVAALRARVTPLLAEERITEAYALTQGADPDARIFVDSFITLHCLHSTPHATANAAFRVIEAIIADDGRRIAGQVRLEGEAFGVTGPLGVPLSLSRTGWRLGQAPDLAPDEWQALQASARAIAAAIAEPVIGAEG